MNETSNTSNIECCSEDFVVPTESNNIVDDDDVNFRTLCQRLQSNDTSLTTLMLEDAIVHPSKATALQQSLQNNTSVNTLVVDLGHVNKTTMISSTTAFGWMDYIQTAPFVAVEVINNSLVAGADQDGTACTILIVLLLAVSKNPSIKELTFNNNNNDAAVTATDPNKAITPTSSKLQRIFSALSSRRRKLVNAKPLQNATIDAFCECQAIDSLWLEHMDDTTLCQVLHKLQALSNLKTLVLVPNKRYMSTTTIQALTNLLSASTTSQHLQHLEFHSMKCPMKLWQCMSSKSISTTTTSRLTELSIHDCCMDYASTHAFCKLFVGGGGIQKLVVGRNVKLYYDAGTVLSMIVSNTTATCSLRVIDVSYCTTLGGPTGLSKFLSAMTTTTTPSTNNNPAISDDETSQSSTTATGTTTTSPTKQQQQQHCVVERIEFGTFHTVEERHVLESMIPLVRGLRHVSMVLATSVLGDTKDELIRSFQTNTTLETCTINDDADINLFYYPDREPSIYFQAIQGGGSSSSIENTTTTATADDTTEEEASR